MESNMKENNNDNSLLTDIDVIQINFIILKCFNLIDWSWYKVFIPTFIYIIFYCFTKKDEKN